MELEPHFLEDVAGVVGVQTHVESRREDQVLVTMDEHSPSIVISLTASGEESRVRQSLENGQEVGDPFEIRCGVRDSES
jgi:hypothetical protein